MEARVIEVRGYRVPTDEELERAGARRGGGLVAPMCRDPEGVLRVRLRARPTGVARFGVLLCLAVGDKENVVSFPDWPGSVGFPAREVADAAMAAVAEQWA